MENMRSTMESILNSVFYIWGFAENPAEEKAKETIRNSPADKIKKDLKRVNADFRESYSKVRNSALSICE